MMYELLIRISSNVYYKNYTCVFIFQIAHTTQIIVQTLRFQLLHTSFYIALTAMRNIMQ